MDSDGVNSAPATSGSIFQHNLFHIGAKTVLDGDAKESATRSHPARLDAPSNAETNGNRSMMTLLKNGTFMHSAANNDDGDTPESASSDESLDDEETQQLCADVLLTGGESESAVLLQRNSCEDPWNVCLIVVQGTSPRKNGLRIEGGRNAKLPCGLEDGDIVRAINGVRLGSPGCANVEQVMNEWRYSTSVEISISRVARKETTVPSPSLDDKTGSQTLREAKNGRSSIEESGVSLHAGEKGAPIKDRDVGSQLEIEDDTSGTRTPETVTEKNTDTTMGDRA